MNIQNIKTSLLIPYDRNTKKHDKKLLTLFRNCDKIIL